MNTYPTIKHVTPAVLRAMGKQEATYAELVQALRLIEHATAPTPDDGGHHEAAHSIATEVLFRVLAVVADGKAQEPVAEVIIGGNGHIGILPLGPLEHEQPLYAAPRPRIKDLIAEERQRIKDLIAEERQRRAPPPEPELESQHPRNLHP